MLESSELVLRYAVWPRCQRGWRGRMAPGHGCSPAWIWLPPAARALLVWCAAVHSHVRASTQGLALQVFLGRGRGATRWLDCDGSWIWCERGRRHGA